MGTLHHPSENFKWSSSSEYGPQFSCEDLGIYFPLSLLWIALYKYSYSYVLTINLSKVVHKCQLEFSFFHFYPIKRKN